MARVYSPFDEKTVSRVSGSWARQLGSLEGDLTTAQTSLTTAQGDITTVAGDLDTLEGRFRTARAATGNVNASSRALVTVTWGTAFADTNYTVTATMYHNNGSALAGLRVLRIDSFTASQVVICVENDVGATRSGTIHLVAVHD